MYCICIVIHSNLANNIESKSICHSRTFFIFRSLPSSFEYFQDRTRMAAFQRYDPSAITARCTDSIVPNMRGNGD